MERNVKDPMTFMTQEQAAENDKRVNSFIKAFQFGAPEFFEKIMDAYEKHGLKGIKMIEKRLDIYMHISEVVSEEVVDTFKMENHECVGSDHSYTESGEEECAD